MTIPQELKDRKQWCCWVNSNGNKLPITPSGGTFRSNDPSTFATFDEAEASGRPIAYVIQADDDLTGIDLDNCIDDSGKIRDWAIPIVTRLDGISYGEISPSGKGIKFLTRASKAKGSRCKHVVGDSKQQIEVFDFNRFWTITKDVYAGNTSIGDGSAAVDWICKTYLMEGGTKGNLQDIDWLGTETRTIETPLRLRAEQYADTIPLTGEGGRNNAIFSMAGHLFSMVDSRGLRLTTDQVVEVVLAWNARLSEPLSPKEVLNAVNSADKNGTKREEKPPKLVAVSTPRLSKAEVCGLDFPVCAKRPPGLIADIMDYTLRTSMYPQPELALAGAIALMATITGRRLADCYGNRTNVYVIGLAPSGSGKEQARKTNKSILAMAGGEHMIGPERIGSSAGMVTHISMSPAILFQLDEMGRMLATLKSPNKAPHLYNIATVLMQIYGSSDTIWIGDAYADAKKTQKINQPHAVIYGTAVPSGFWESMTADNITDGLIGRLLPFESRTGYVDPQTPEIGDPPKSIIDQVSQWLGAGQLGNLGDKNPVPIIARYTPEAKQRYDNHMMEISERRRTEDEQAAALWSRAAGKAGKLALIFAASRQLPSGDLSVGFEDIDCAIKLSNYITRRIQRQVFEHVSVNDQEERTKKVFRLLASPMNKSQLTRKTQWLGKRDRNEILETLIESGMIEYEIQETEGGGPQKVVYRRSTLN
jgi:hypothetical protein